MTGFVYVMSNESLPGLIKIGKSIDPEKRVKTLSSEGLPTPFHIEFQIKSEHYSEIETAVHSSLSNYRVSENREFFDCDIEAASTAITTTKNQIESQPIELPNENNLTDYIAKHYSGNQAAFARAVGVQPAQVTQWLKSSYVVISGNLYYPIGPSEKFRNYGNKIHRLARQELPAVPKKRGKKK